MKTKISILTLIFITLLITQNCFAQSGWFQLNSATTKNLTSACFINEFTGYAVGDSGIIIKTINGGISWMTQITNTLNLLNSVYFIPQSSGNTGYAVGYDKTILKTTNAGANWNLVPSGLSFGTFNSVYFTSPDAGYIGHGIMDIYGAVLRTTNGGTLWSNNSVSADPVYGICFSNALTGYAVGGDFESGPMVVKTTNAGSSWNVQYLNSGFTLHSIYFHSLLPSTGYTAGAIGKIFKTTNYGINWTELNSGTENSLFSVFFTSVDTGYCAGVNGTILKTINSGVNWNSQVTGTNNDLLSINFINSNTGYAVGENGTVLKTTTGGIIGINVISNNVPSDYFLSQNYPNPFNPTTKIRFSIPLLRGVDDAEGGRRGVFLKIYNILGHEISTLVNEQLLPGTYEVEWDGSKFASGTYFYKLISSDFIETKKMIYIK